MGYEILPNHGFCTSDNYSGWRTPGTAKTLYVANDPYELVSKCNQDPFCVGFTFIGIVGAKSIIYTNGPDCQLNCDNPMWNDNPLLINKVTKTKHHGHFAKCFRYNPCRCKSCFYLDLK